MLPVTASITSIILLMLPAITMGSIFESAKKKNRTFEKNHWHSRFQAEVAKFKVQDLNEVRKLSQLFFKSSGAMT